ncbi:MAG: hypothetical protein KKA19_04205 [Candidatus Margulisbacteria bacterium]|nr:hypothetical protein [Candidatus Margulisiibacteriota bacterium]
MGKEQHGNIREKAYNKIADSNLAKRRFGRLQLRYSNTKRLADKCIIAQ